MKKIRVAIVGYGNIGQYALQALEAAPDMEIAGVVRRSGSENKPTELTPYPVVKHVSELENVDVAILATPTRSVEQYALECLTLGINTVDSFDIHSKIVDLRRSLDAAAKEHGAVATYIRNHLNEWIKDNLTSSNYNVEIIKHEQPWNRFFETGLLVKTTFKKD